MYIDFIQSLIRLIYLSQGKGDNSRNPECGKIGPTQGRAGIFLFFNSQVSTSIFLRSLFLDSKILLILLKCWTEPSLKDLMWNIKYFLDIKNGSVIYSHFTNNSRCQLSRNDRYRKYIYRLYKTKTACKLFCCVSFHEGLNL